MSPSQADVVARIAELAAGVVRLASEQGVRIAVAESLTGGLLADAIVSIPGASRVFSGGIVAYDTALKHSLLGVDASLLRERGPVDGKVARQMAAGVRRACAVPRTAEGAGDGVGAARDGMQSGGDPVPADIGIATTGVAGPNADPQTGQPAGTVWIGMSAGSSADSTSILLSPVGERPAIRRESVAAALEHLHRYLQGSAAKSD